jgi:hypothetical protein
MLLGACCLELAPRTRAALRSCMQERSMPHVHACMHRFMHTQEAHARTAQPQNAQRKGNVRTWHTAAAWQHPRLFAPGPHTARAQQCTTKHTEQCTLGSAFIASHDRTAAELRRRARAAETVEYTHIYRQYKEVPEGPAPRARPHHAGYSPLMLSRGALLTTARPPGAEPVVGT